jgi:hypothetical protein
LIATEFFIIHGIPHPSSSDETTDKTTRHLAMPPNNGGQVIGYSHSTRRQAVKSLVILKEKDAEGRCGRAFQMLSLILQTFLKQSRQASSQHEGKTVSMNPARGKTEIVGKINEFT